MFSLGRCTRGPRGQTTSLYKKFYYYFYWRAAAPAAGFSTWPAIKRREENKAMNSAAENASAIGADSSKTARVIGRRCDETMTKIVGSSRVGTPLEPVLLRIRSKDPDVIHTRLSSVRRCCRANGMQNKTVVRSRSGVVVSTRFEDTILAE